MSSNAKNIVESELIFIDDDGIMINMENTSSIISAMLTVIKDLEARITTLETP